MHETEMDRNTLFYKNLPPGFVPREDSAHRRLFREYGAVFVARGGVLPPEKVVFENEVDVAEFQSRMNIREQRSVDFNWSCSPLRWKVCSVRSMKQKVAALR